MTTLLISDSWDATSDIVVRRLGERVFRLNTDLIRDYSIDWNPAGFILASPNGRTLSSSQVHSVYWRKPFTSVLYSQSDQPEAFFFSECRYAIRELYNAARAGGAHALVEEGAERRLGKLRQLKIASQYFNVPEWRVLLGTSVSSSNAIVVKSLSGEPVSEEAVLYTSLVTDGSLDSNYLWFTQNYIKKTADITLVYVDGRMFAFRCTAYLDTVDWRERLADMQPSDWKLFPISSQLSASIRAFMADCGLRFGRLDFVTDESQLFFLEVNPNGQWAWLDLTDEHGLLSAMIDAIEGR